MASLTVCVTGAVRVSVVRLPLASYTKLRVAAPETDVRRLLVAP
jgi:hypothetical protein